MSDIIKDGWYYQNLAEEIGGVYDASFAPCPHCGNQVILIRAAMPSESDVEMINEKIEGQNMTKEQFEELFDVESVDLELHYGMFCEECEEINSIYNANTIAGAVQSWNMSVWDYYRQEDQMRGIMATLVGSKQAYAQYQMSYLFAHMKYMYCLGKTYEEANAEYEKNGGKETILHNYVTKHLDKESLSPVLNTLSAEKNDIATMCSQLDNAKDAYETYEDFVEVLKSNAYYDFWVGNEDVISKFIQTDQKFEGKIKELIEKYYLPVF